MSGKSAYMDWSVENRYIHCNRTMRPANRKSDLVAESVHASRGYCHRCYSRVRRGSLDKLVVDWSVEVTCPGCGRELRNHTARKDPKDKRTTHYSRGLCKRCYVGCSGDILRLVYRPILTACIDCGKALPIRTARLKECSALCHDRYYRRNNPNIIQAIKTRRRYREVSIFQISLRDLDRLLIISRNRCNYCEVQFSPTNKVNWDHVVPLSRGGLHCIGNLAPSCRKCNTSKGKRFLVEWKNNPLRP